MPHCPECGGSIDDFSDLRLTKQSLSDPMKEAGTAMYSCGACGVVLGFSEFAFPTGPP
jgi:hypothetical protein